MRKFGEDEINYFLNQFDYDVRKTKDARWIDQKCAMDVVTLIADCILEFVKDDIKKEFSVKDIWRSDYAVKNIQEIFAKPDPSKKAKHEYDKYFSQPIKLFGYSHILNCKFVKGKYIYSVNNLELLEFISIRERNAHMFLCLYIEKVLKDSGIYEMFNKFFKEPSKDTYSNVKEGFSNFTIENTSINGETECNRIFIKVLNPLAYKYKSFGTEWGRISKDIITFDKIAYNQRNWRDLYSNKPKNVTREEYEKTLLERPENKMLLYKINKAKRIVRDYNDKYFGGKPELKKDILETDIATQMHHIFPVGYYPEISDYLENIIALTPTQHFNYAHPMGNTSCIDKKYQYYCLIAKIDMIFKNLTSEELPEIYSFKDLKIVLNTGLETERFNEVEELDFSSVIRMVEEHYDVA